MFKPKKIYYEKEPTILEEVLNEIRSADLIVLSMGSLYTSILPNLLSKQIIETIDESNAEIMYACNLLTQPGETDNYKASEMKEKYATLEQKDPVICDIDELKKITNVIGEDLTAIEDGILRHNVVKLGFHIYSYMIL